MFICSRSKTKDSFHSVIQCGVFKNNTRSVFDDKREYTGPLWEQVEQAYDYDGSIDDAISICMPNGLLIEGLSLHQKEYNGHFYNDNNELIIIDGRTAGCAEGLLIREDREFPKVCVNLHTDVR